MKIYTKTGDLGDTALVSGRRISKADLRIDAYGTVDELNTWMGLLGDNIVEEQTTIRAIQNKLFMIGSHLANDPEKPFDLGFEISEQHIEILEKWIDSMTSQLSPLRNFILPGGHQTVSYCQIARTVCRRTERLCVALNSTSPISPLLIKYLNRLSDALFTLGRFQSKQLGVEEIIWVKE